MIDPRNNPFDDVYEDYEDYEDDDDWDTIDIERNEKSPYGERWDDKEWDDYRNR